MYELTIMKEFEAAHLIPDYPGKCCRLHGHNWKVEIALTGEKLNELEMIIDFKDFKNVASKVVDNLDHRFLNEMEPFRKSAPTAENIAKYIYDQLVQGNYLPDNVRLEFVKVWESPRSAVKYSRKAQA